MSQAAEIMYSNNNANDVMTAAVELANDIDQDWEHEATFFVFDDESVLVVSGIDVKYNYSEIGGGAMLDGDEFVAFGAFTHPDQIWDKFCSSFE